MAANDNELHDLAPGYALGALDDAERRSFEEHLDECERCREDVAGFADTAAALAYAAEGPAPLPELRGRILDAARQEKGNVVPLRRRWSPPVLVAAAAAACLAIGLGIWATVGADTPANRELTVELQGKVGTLQVDSAGEAILTVRDLAPAPAGKTYEVWVIEKDVPKPAGTFTFGGAQVSVKVDGKVRPGATVGVTLERLPGARKPTPPILFQASIPV